MILLTLAPRRIRSAVRARIALRLCVNMLELALVIYWMFVVGIMLILGHNFTDANWLVWQTSLTIGYGTNLPEEWRGKWFTMIMGTFAVLSSTAVFGAIINFINELQAREQGGFMKNPHSNGYVIVGYPGEGNLLELIRQMRITQVNIPICVIDSVLDALPLSIRELPDVHFVRGGHLRREIYEQARIEKQLGVAVFPIDRNDENSDAVTANAVRLILKYIKEKGSNTRVISLLVDNDNEHLLADLPSPIITKRSDMFLVNQELQGEGTASVIDDMMRNDRGEDPQTYNPSLTVGMTWGELVERSLRLYKEGVGVAFTPLALLRDGMRHFHPSFDTALRANDRVCVVAMSSFDWEKTERALTGKEVGVRTFPTLVSGNR